VDDKKKKVLEGTRVKLVDCCFADDGQEAVSCCVADGQEAVCVVALQMGKRLCVLLRCR
jgi:hypothetical protein